MAESPVMKKTALRLAALTTCAVLSVAAAPKKPTLPPQGSSNWTATTAVTANGSHRVGKPDAQLKLVEYVS